MTPIKTRTSEFYCLENNIFLWKIIEDAEINMNDSIENLNAIRKLSGHEPYALLIDARAHVIISKESIQHAGEAEANANLVAHAIVANSLANRIIGNFICKLKSQYAPSRLFSSKDEALSWLKAEVKNSQLLANR